MGMLAEARASRKNRQRDGTEDMEGFGDDCSQETSLSSGDQSPKGRAVWRNIAHAGASRKEELRITGVAKPSWNSIEETREGGSPDEQVDGTVNGEGGHMT